MVILTEYDESLYGYDLEIDKMPTEISVEQFRDLNTLLGKSNNWQKTLEYILGPICSKIQFTSCKHTFHDNMLCYEGYNVKGGCTLNNGIETFYNIDLFWDGEMFHSQYWNITLHLGPFLPKITVDLSIDVILNVKPKVYKNARITAKLLQPQHLKLLHESKYQPNVGTEYKISMNSFQKSVVNSKALPECDRLKVG